MTVLPSAEPDLVEGHSASTNGAERRPRVAYLVSRFPKITETFVLYEMKALEDAGAQVEVFALRREPPGPRHPEAVAFEERAHFAPLSSIEVIRANLARLLGEPARYLGIWWEALAGTWKSPKFFLGALLWFPKCVAFARLVGDLDVDHLHAHFAHHPALAALVVHRLVGVPYSFTAHGSDLHVDRTMLAAKVASASFVVAVSDYNRELIVEECGEGARDKVRVIHCGADPSVFSGAPRGDGTTDRERSPYLRIACVASLEEVKGHRYLLEACRLLGERDVDYRCDLVGGGALRGSIERRVRELGLEERVHLHGAVPRPEVERILSMADVAVLASTPTASGRREGIPVALMEAMMSRLPVVASGVSGIPELVREGETGFLVPPADPRSLAERLETLAADPDLKTRLGAAGRRVVATDFDLDTGARLLYRAIVTS